MCSVTAPNNCQSWPALARYLTLGTVYAGQDNHEYVGLAMVGTVSK